MMKTNGKKMFCKAVGFYFAFGVWTGFVLCFDVQAAGVKGTDIGFASVNTFFHRLTGTDMFLYTLTDWLGLVPVMVCIGFGVVGLFQLIKRKSIFKVDRDIILSGVYYAVVIVCYLAFEIFPVNYRPILINEVMEASYPSSTTLLVLAVMPTLEFWAERRFKKFSKPVIIVSKAFSLFMVTARLVCGVHWLTDIAGAILLAKGLFYSYKSAVLLAAGD